MCKAVEPSYLQMLLDWPKKPEWIEVVESLSAVGSAGATVQVGLQTPFKPVSFSEYSAETSQGELRRASERSARRLEDGLGKEREEVRVKLDLGVDVSEAEAKGERKELKAVSEETRAAVVAHQAATGRVAVVYLSNAHVEAMLMKVFGPRSAEQSAVLFRAIRMPEIKQDGRGSSFANLSVAMVYVRKWRETLRWCARQLPRSHNICKAGFF
jgi:hypothetical protein